MLEEEGLLRLVKSVNSASSREFLDDLFWQLTQLMDSTQGMDDDVSATLFEYQGPEVAR